MTVSTLQQWAVRLHGRWLASDLLRKFSEMAATRVLLLVLGLGTSVIVARLLGPEGRGHYAVAFTVGSIGLQFGNLGLHAYNTYVVARDRSALGALLANSVIVGVVVGGAIALGLLTLYILAPQRLLLAPDLLWPVLVFIPLTLIYLLLQNLLLGIQATRVFNLIELAVRVLGVALIVPFVALRAVSAATLFGASLGASGVGLVWAGAYLARQLSQAPRPAWRLFRAGLGYGSRAYLAALFSFLVLKFDVLQVQHYLGAEATGYYSLALSMSDLMYMVPVTVGTLLFPKLSAMASSRDKWHYARRIAGYVGAGMAAAALAAGLAGPTLIRVLYGAEFLPAYAAFAWMLPAVVLLSVNIVLSNYFGAIGMPNIVVYSPALALAAKVALNLWLLPPLGIVGAAVSSVVAYALMLFLSIHHLVGHRHRHELAVS